MPTSRSSPKLCFITDRHLAPDDLPERADLVLSAGFEYLMLREKDLPEEELLELALSLKEKADRHGRRLIVNSSLEVALKAGAWGLHLPFRAACRQDEGPGEVFSAPQPGQCSAEEDGVPPEVLKKTLAFKAGSGLKIGVSVHSFEEAEAAVRAGADLLMAGNIFPSECKPGRPGLGLDFLRELASAFDIPLWAVGGISPANVRSVFKAGASTACVRSPLLRSSEPLALTREYLRAACGEASGA